MMLLVSPCNGVGRNVIAYELLHHSLVNETKVGYLIDVSSRPSGLLDHDGCLINFLMKKSEWVECYRELPSSYTILYSRLFSFGCVRSLPPKTLSKAFSNIEDIVDRFITHVSELEEDSLILINAHYDIFTSLFIEMLYNKMSHRLESILIVGKESTKCFKNILLLLSRISLPRVNLLLNKVPVARSLRIKKEIEEIFADVPLNLVVVVPLTTRLYYRGIEEYTSVLFRSNSDVKAAVFSQLFTRTLKHMRLKNVNRFLTVLGYSLYERPLTKII